MKTPRLADHWPETAREWEIYSLCSQLLTDERRQMKADTRRHRREMWQELAMGAAVILMLYVIAWGLFVLVSA